MKSRMCAFMCAFMVAACQTTQPGIEVRTVEKVVEVQRPCPGTPPVRPAPLGELAATSPAALAQVLAKLAEWSGEGQFGDRAEAYFEACPPSE
jgi:hypothetical protein